jgi:hypothetical protein
VLCGKSYIDQRQGGVNCKPYSSLVDFLLARQSISQQGNSVSLSNDRSLYRCSRPFSKSLSSRSNGHKFYATFLLINNNNNQGEMNVIK